MDGGRVPVKGALACGRRGWPFLALAGAAAVFYREPLLTDRTFYFRDVSTILEPMRRLAADLLRAGEWPLWNPYVAGGQPLAAESVHNVFYPLSALYYVLPFDVGFKLWVIGHYPLAGIGMYLLLREWGTSRRGAVFGGLGLMLSGPLVSLTNVVTFLAGFAWLPFTLLAFSRAVRGPAWPAAGWAAAGLALQALGDPQMVYFTLLTLAVYGSVHVRRPVPGSGARIAGLLAGVGILAALLAAVQLVPLAELFRASTRSGGLSPDEVDSWRLHGVRLVELILPRLLGDPTRETYWAHLGVSYDLPWLLSPYLGLSTLGFAALAILVVHRRVTGFLAVLSAGSGLLAFGDATPAHAIAQRLLPLIGVFRFPAKWWLLTAFGVCGLAALGVDAATRALDASGRRRLAAGWALAGLGLLGLAAAGWLRPEIAAALSPIFRTGQPGAVLTAFFQRRLVAGSLLAAGLAIGAALAVALSGRGAAARAAAGGALVGLLFLDLLASGSLLAPVAPVALYHTPSPLLDALPPAERAFRVLVRLEGAPPLDVLRRHSLEYYQQIEKELYLNAGIRYRLFMFSGGTAAVLRDFETLRRALDSAGRYDRFLRLWSVRHVTGREPMPGVALERVTEVPMPPLGPTTVFRLPGALPRAWMAWRARRVADPAVLLARMTAEGWDPRQETLLEGPEGPEEAGDGSARIEVVRLGASDLEVAVAGTGGWVVLAEAWYPGWRAWVDGRPATLERANYAQRAVRVGEGSHRVRLAYRPWTVAAGGAVSVLAWLGLLGAGLGRWWARRRRA